LEEQHPNNNNVTTFTARASCLEPRHDGQTYPPSSPTVLRSANHTIQKSNNHTDQSYSNEDYETNATSTDHVPVPQVSITDLDAMLHNASSVMVDEAVDRSTTFPLSPDMEVFVQQVAHHASFEQWVVFSDLHVSTSTIDTCLQVLQTVHQTAVSQTKPTGVVFLGDFWHQRGSLRVDCLNTILTELATWKVPLVMIPGNHDQVTWEGHVHALTALQNSFRLETTTNDADGSSLSLSSSTSIPGPLIFTQPTVFRKALWIPHIREHTVMESVLHSSHALTAQAVMCHADVTGASMNDLLVSTGGLPPRWFPTNIPVYSGHFHKAHTVTYRGNRNIEYIGSPYQVSLSEAQQPKALVIMDKDWTIVQHIPLHLGRFHFRPQSRQEFLTLQPQQSSTRSGGTTDPSSPVDHDGDFGNHNSNAVYPGDRIVWSMDTSDWETLPHDEQVQNHLEQLRQVGASVEIRQNPTKLQAASSFSRSNEIEDLSVESIWKAYVEAEVERGALSESNKQIFYQKGVELLESVQTVQEVQSGTGTLGSHLDFHSVKIEGFGPFTGTVEYPLDQRGLVLVRGVNQDEGSDSNGTGKSSLAMAPLWALTGALDPRPLPDNKVADVVNDDAKVARVTLSGALNGMDFTIIRSKTNKRGGLTFLFNGEDLTTQSIKETQVVMDQVLGISQTLLFRGVFFGQHPLNDLLGATDARFKEELALLVPLITWQEVLALTRRLVRECEKKSAEIEGKLAIRTDDLAKYQEKTRQANETYLVVAREFEELEESLSPQLGEMHNSSVSSMQNSTEQMTSFESQIDELSEKLVKLEQERNFLLGRRKEAEKVLTIGLSRSRATLDEISQELAEKQRTVDVCNLNYRNAVETVSKLESEFGFDGKLDYSNTINQPPECSTCGQPLSGESSAHYHGHVQQAIARALETRISAEQKLEASQKDLVHAKAMHVNQINSTAYFEETQRESLSLLNERIDAVESETRKTWQEREGRMRDLAALTRQRQSWMEALSAEQKLNSEREVVLRLEAALNTAEDEMQQCGKMIDELTSEKKQELEKSMLLKDLSNAFGQRGIQVFVLRTALQALQSITQSYLDILSDYTIELHLSLDDGERILRRVEMLSGGSKVERSLASLSGGQWRRCSLALQLGFADLLCRRGKLSSSLLVFDEPLTHLDQSGRSACGRLLRRILQENHSTILLILQDLAAEELGESFDAIDTVRKSQGRSTVQLDN
jgi:DNA repair exonuclease SbcCD ATPase subunit/DNA repair exonuclease SbcCD nuclease subunit